MIAAEMEDYQRGFQNALSSMQRKYTLSNRNVPITSNQKRPTSPKDTQPQKLTSTNQQKDKEPDTTNQKKSNEASTSNPKKDKETQTAGPRKEIPAKEQSERKDVTSKEVEKYPNLFSLENEISKLKVSIPLTELVKNDQYKFHVAKMLKVDQMSDMVNVSDDHPELCLAQP
jgi:hypothetical protein